MARSVKRLQVEAVDLAEARDELAEWSVVGVLVASGVKAELVHRGLAHLVPR